MNPSITSSKTVTGAWISWKTAFFLGIAFLIYLPAIRGGFIWDDDSYVTGNMALRSLGGLWKIWFHPGWLDQYYPLTYSSFWLEYHLWGLHASGYHVINVILHVINSLLVGSLLKRLHVKNAWFVSLLFLLHPVMVESVAWITERKNVLSGFFYLSAFLSYLRFKEEKAERWYLLSLLFFLGALLSKTVTATFPAVLLLTLWWKEGGGRRQDFLRMVPFFIAGIALGTVTSLLENRHIAIVASNEWDFSWAERCLIAGRAFWFYLGKLIWPHPLLFIYPRWTIDASILWQWCFPAAFFLLMAALWKFRTRWGRGPFTALAIFTVTLLPALGIKSFFPMRYAFVADHFQYLAAIAPLSLGAAGIAALFEKRAVIRNAVIIVVLMIFALLSWEQSFIYKDLETLWRTIISKNPNCWMAFNNLGAALANSDRDQEADPYFKEALRLKPDYADAYGNLGYLAEKHGELDKALGLFQKAVDLMPHSRKNRHHLGSALLHLGKPDEAIPHFLAAINPEREIANTIVYFDLGNAYFTKDDPESAVQWYRKALTANPEFANAYVNLATALDKLGQTENAFGACEKALAMDPDNAMGHDNFANMLSKHGQIAQADRHYREAIRLDPNLVLFRLDYAAFLTRQKRIDEAITQYNEVLRLDPKNPVAQNNLRRIAFQPF